MCDVNSLMTVLLLIPNYNKTFHVYLFKQSIHILATSLYIGILTAPRLLNCAKSKLFAPNTLNINVSVRDALSYYTFHVGLHKACLIHYHYGDGIWAFFSITKLSS